METKTTELNASRPQARKVWEAPRIALERSLEVSAQGSPPGFDALDKSGFLAPMNTSGKPNGVCL